MLNNVARHYSHPFERLSRHLVRFCYAVQRLHTSVSLRPHFAKKATAANYDTAAATIKKQPCQQNDMIAVKSTATREANANYKHKRDSKSCVNGYYAWRDSNRNSDTAVSASCTRGGRGVPGPGIREGVHKVSTRCPQGASPHGHTGQRKHPLQRPRCGTRQPTKNKSHQQ